MAAMLRRQAFALGFGRLPPRCDGVAFRSIAYDGLRGLARSVPGGAVLLLGDEFLREGDPRRLAAIARSPRFLLLGLLPARDDALVARWSRTTEINFATVDTLPALVHEALNAPLRPVVAREEWWPHVPRPTSSGGRFEEVLLFVPDLHALTVQQWAARLGISRRTLFRIVRRACAASPEDILWAYVLALVTACRCRGDSEETTALVCGFADRSTLLRAFRRRDVPFPRRGTNGHRVSPKAHILSRTATSRPAKARA